MAKTKLKLITIISFLLMSCLSHAQSEIFGDWRLAPEAGALGVGPDQGNISWWSSTMNDINTRSCLFDDVFRFSEDGNFSNIMDDATWLEVWQGVNEEGCGTPVAPHDGSNAATYEYDANTGRLTLLGIGAHVGLPKVTNQGEFGWDIENAPSSRTYLVTELTDNTMTLDINFVSGWWRFKLVKNNHADTQVGFETITFDNISDMYGFEGAVAYISQLETSEGNLDNVAVIEKFEAAVAWAGAVLFEDQFEIPINEFNSVITADFYSENPVPVLLKLEDNNSDLTAEIQTFHSGGGWQKLSWNFANTSAISQDYSKLVIFPDFGNQNTNNLFYIDNINLESSSNEFIEANNYVTLGLYAPEANFVDFQSSTNGWSITTPALNHSDGHWYVTFKTPAYLTYNWFVDGELETFENYSQVTCGKVLNLSDIYFPRIWNPDDGSRVDIFGSCDQNINPKMDYEAVFSEAFGGTVIEDNVFTFPIEAEAWGGFANMNYDLYPLRFTNEGSISFMANVLNGGSANVQFRFEYNPYPDVVPSYDTSAVTISGSSPTLYTLNIPSQGENTYSSLIMYINDRDVSVGISDIVVSADYVPVHEEIVELDTVMATFQVDMSGRAVHEEGVYLFLSNGPVLDDANIMDGYLMSDEDGDNHWTISLDLPPDTQYLGKFRNQPSYGTWDGFEDSIGECFIGTYQERYFDVGDADIVFPAVPYGGCNHEPFVESTFDFGSPIDFEQETNFFSFGGMETFIEGGIMTAIKPEGAETWAGTVVTQGARTFPLTNLFNLIKADIHSSIPISVLMKLEYAHDPGQSVEVSAVHYGSGWETLIFDFSDTSAIAVNDYDTLLIYPDFGNVGMGNVFLYDNITIASYEENISNNQAIFADAFGGAIVSEDGNTFTFPSDADQWAGFANTNTDLYPLRFTNNGSISFLASVESGGMANIRFRLEYRPFPDVNPAYDTHSINVHGETPTQYTINIPSQGENKFSSLIMYIDEQDVPVNVTDILLESDTFDAPETVNVTFQVDMSGVETHQDGVYIAGGSFFGQEGILLTHIGNDIWSTTVELDYNALIYYKFRNQPSYGSWDGFEDAIGLRNGGCSGGNYDDRFIEVADIDIILPVVAYGSCSALPFSPVSQDSFEAGDTISFDNYIPIESHGEIDSFIENGTLNVKKYPWSQPWGLALIVGEYEYPMSDNNSIISANVYSDNPEEISLVLHNNPWDGDEAYVSVSHSGNGWEELVFDFSGTQAVFYDPPFNALGFMPAPHGVSNETIFKIDNITSGSVLNDESNSKNEVILDIGGNFGGATIDDATGVYTFPSGAESWAGFAGIHLASYPLTFGDGGSISFDASVVDGGSTDIRFRLEYNPYPNVDPAYETASVTVSGSDVTSYTIDIPSQGENTFRSVIMYIVSQDVGVAISNVVVNADTLIQRDPVTLTLTVEASGDAVRLTGPTWDWQDEGGPEAVDNGNGTWTVTLENVISDIEYLWVVDGVRENLLDNDPFVHACTPVTDNSGYAIRNWSHNTSNTWVADDIYDFCRAQIISVAGEPSIRADGNTSLTIKYNTSDQTAHVTGLGLRIHYDSSALNYIDYQDLLTENNFTSPYLSSDTEDYDNDPKTDYYIGVNWASLFVNDFPGAVPSNLLTLNFSAGDLEGVENTQINFSSPSNAADYVFSANNYSMPVVSQNWDIDGNGTTDALTDGLLLIRYMFGLRGEILSANTVADNSALTSNEIESRVGGLMSISDIDGDGKVTALSDGLLVLRHLFGMSGNDLIKGVVHPDGSRQTASEIANYINSHMNH